MAATITVYTFEDEEGREQLFETQDVQEAKEYARENHLIAIANEYEWSEAIPVPDWDFRPPKPDDETDDEEEARQ
jgi:hypothetical protein